MYFEKKKKKLQNEPFSGPSEMCVCVFRLPFAQPPVRRSIAFSFIVFMSRVHDASAHPHDLETSVSQGGREG